MDERNHSVFLGEGLKFNFGVRMNRRSMARYRLGLKPIIRRVYVPEGETPVVNVNWRFKWLWLYALIHINTGETSWWILPYVNTELFNRVLADFAREFELGHERSLTMDERNHFVFLGEG